MSVYRDPRSPYYTYDFQISGVRFKGATSEKTERGAREAERLEKIKAKAEIESGQHDGGVPLTIKEAADRYNSEHKNDSDAASVESDLEYIVSFFGEHKRVAEISGNDVARLVADKKGQFRWNDPKMGHVTPSRINRCTVQLLRRIVLRAIDLGTHVPKVPKWSKYLLDEPKGRKRRMVEHEHTDILNVMDHEYVYLLQFALVTGLRQTASLLLWKNVDFIAKTYKYIGKGDDPRAGDELREKTMTPEAEKILRSRIGHNEIWVFTYITKRGKNSGIRAPITKDGLKSHWRRLKDTLKIHGLWWHDLRRTFASNLLKQTGNLALVQDALDHASPMTTRRYAYVESEDLVAGMKNAEQTYASKFQVPAQIEYHPAEIALTHTEPSTGRRHASDKKSV